MYTRAASLFDMPLLTELETTFADVHFYKHAAPSELALASGRVRKRLLALARFLWDDKLVRFTRPGLTEEYSVSVDGVRQDFIIESPPLTPHPSTLNQSMRVELALSGARPRRQLPAPGSGWTARRARWPTAACGWRMSRAGN